MQARKMVTMTTAQDGDATAFGYPGSHPPLTKHDLTQLVQKQAQLNPKDCEKIAALRQEHDHATAAFEMARQERTGESADDDARSQLVKDKLAALKSKTDRECKQQNEVVKAFNQEFSSTFAKRKQVWYKTHDEFLSKFKDVTGSIDQEVDKLLEIIASEHDACLADTDAEINRIVVIEKERSDTFDRLVADRVKEHTSFKRELTETFNGIRRRIAREGQVREVQTKATHDEAVGAYVEVDAHIKELSAKLERDIEEIQEKLVEENDERIHAQDRVVADMNRFIKSIEDNVAERQRGVGETQNLLKDLRKMLHEG